MHHRGPAASALATSSGAIGHFFGFQIRIYLLFSESACNITIRMKKRSPAGPRADRLPQRKRRLVARLKIPPNALPGSLALTYRRCGKPSCHCADGQGHPLWSLTFMAEGKKRVEHIPQAWVDAVRQRVDQGRKFKETLAELFVLNAELLFRERQQQPPKNGPQRLAN